MAFKEVADASFQGIHNISGILSRSKNIKMFQQYVFKNTFKNQFKRHIVQPSQRLLLTVILEDPVVLL